MTPTTPDQVLQAALKLSESDRLRISEQLLASLPVPTRVMSEGDPALPEELRRRSAAMESGEDPGVDGFEALAELRERSKQQIEP